MLNVEMKKCGSTYVLHMEGHAGQADVGHDIVCAAASILCYTAAQTALDLYEQGKLRKKPRVEVGKGDATVTLCPVRGRNFSSRSAVFSFSVLVQMQGWQVKNSCS